MASLPTPAPKRDPGHGSARSSSFERVSDERDFDGTSAVAPDSQDTGGNPFTDLSVRKFSTGADKISESTLSQGFCFQPKQPPRPGQFSERPQQKELHPQALLHQPPRPFGTPERRFTNSSVQGSAPRPERRDPLDLPELGLSGKLASPNGFSEPFTCPANTTNVTAAVNNYQESHSHSESSKTSLSQAKSRHFSPDDAQQPERPRNPQAICLVADSQQLLKTPTAPSGSTHHSNREEANVSSCFRPPTRKVSAVSRNGPTTTVTPHSQHPRDFMLPTHHRRGAAHIQRKHSPASTCGDLEGPAYQSPPGGSSRAAHKPTKSRSNTFPRPSERDKGARHRSQSIASNISRKRTGTHENLTRPHHKRQCSRPEPENSAAHPDLERRTVAMQQVAHSWNEWMGIAEEETSRAKVEIGLLQGEIQRQESKLEESRSTLEEKNSHIRDIESRCESLEKQGSDVRCENERLGSEAEVLRNQLAESKQRATALREKRRDYRTRLNEAITEQQDLFRRSQVFYDSAKRELEEQRAKHAAHADSVDVALQNSRKKREEMKKCIEDMSAEAAHQQHLKDQTIVEMKEKLKDHEARLEQEKCLTNELRGQMETQRGVQETAQASESKIDSLLESCAKSDQEHQQQAEFTDSLNTKLDLILQHVKSSQENATHQDDLQVLANKMQEKVEERILPVVSALLSRQEETERKIAGLAGAFQREAGNVKSRMDQQDQQSAQTRIEDAMIVSHVVDVFKQLEANLEKTTKTCQQMEQRLDTWSQSNQKTQQDPNGTCSGQLTQLLAERSETISDLQRQLQLTAEEYAGKTEEMRATILRNDEATKKGLDEATSELHRKLDLALGQERERSEQMLRQSEAARNLLQNQLNETKERLAVNGPNTNGDLEALKRSLQEEQSSSVQLTEKVRYFEQETRATEHLRERWRRDMKAIDRLRPQLKSISERVPQMGEFGARLKKIAQLNGFIQSTANYLATESSWVRQLLESRGQSEQGSALIAEAGFVAPDDYQNPAGELLAPSQDDFADRKVVVHSPCVGASSPSLPPSVEQEQKRRRDGKQPRSILKLSASSLAEVSGTESQFFARPANHTQYNRPVMGGINSAGSGAKSDMIEQIRSGLVQKNRSDGSWSLPTVAEFEMRSQTETASSKRAQPSSGGTSNGVAKRPKMEKGGSSQVIVSE